MKKTQQAFRQIRLAAAAAAILGLWPGTIPAQAPMNVEWAGGGVFYDQQASRSVRYNTRSRKRSQELQAYGSLRYGEGKDTPAIMSLDSPESNRGLSQQTLEQLPEGARELKVSDDLTYYVVDGQYFRKTIEGGTVKYIAMPKP